MASALGLAQPTISEWLRGARRVPAERCPEIERETKRLAAEKGDPSLIVTCEELRPDMAWSVLREQVVVAAEPLMATTPEQRTLQCERLADDEAALYGKRVEPEKAA